MALTSPDNIWTPDSSDNYALTTDLAATADSVQDAITALRGNNAPTVRVANVAERNAALADHGTPTTSNPLIVFRADAGAGRELEYTTNGTTWRTLVAEQDTGWLPATVSGGFTTTIESRKVGGLVQVRGRTDRNTGNLSVGDTVALLHPDTAPGYSWQISAVGVGASTMKVSSTSDGRTLTVNSAPTIATSYVAIFGVAL